MCNLNLDLSLDFIDADRFSFTAMESLEEVEGLFSDLFWQQQVGNGRDATHLLLDILKQDYFQKLMKHESVVRYKFWEKISDEMATMGFPIPNVSRKEAGLKCNRRWVFLCQRYNIYKEAEKTGKKMKQPKYFNEIDAVMRAQSEVNSPSVLDTLEPSSLLVSSAKSSAASLEEIAGN